MSDIFDEQARAIVIRQKSEWSNWRLSIRDQDSLVLAIAERFRADGEKIAALVGQVASFNYQYKAGLAPALGETDRLRTKLAEAQAEINLWRESADSMKAAWNAACADIAALRTKLADARELLVRTHWCRDEATCEVCRWIAANREE